MGTSSDCNDPNGPVRTIQTGIELTQQNGDEVVVADGSYVGPDNRNLTFTEFSPGLPRLITVRSENGPNKCTINCQNKGRGFNFDHVHVGNIGRSAVVQGFTVKRGSSAEGGGFLISQTSPTIRNCIITDNHASLNGGGIFAVKFANPLIEDCVIDANEAGLDGGGIYLAPGPFATSVTALVTDCTIQSNTARRGGGIYVVGTSSAHIKRCTIMNNTASHREGGGITLEHDANVWIVNCFIAGNQAPNSDGGGIALLTSQPAGSPIMEPHVVNVVVTGNTAIRGAGVYMRLVVRDSPPGGVFVNTTIFGNTASSEGGAVRRDTNSATEVASLDNVIVWGNFPTQTQISTDDPSKLTVCYSDIQGGWSGPGHNNIDADPLFVDPVGPDLIPGTADDDFRLSDGSPCIDAARDSLVPNDQTDLDEDVDTGERTPLDLDLFARFADDPATMDTGVEDSPECVVVDMGAYEFQVECTTDEECGDGFQCNGVEICVNGLCEAGVIIDCNENCVRDICDFFFRTSFDRNNNGIPDECECSDATILVASPPDGTLDARRPHPPNDNSLAAREGIGSPNTYTGGPEPITINLGVTGVALLACWDLCETGIEQMEGGSLDSNRIIGVTEVSTGEYEILLERPISAGHWTTITYLGDSTESSVVSYASLPADSNATGVSNGVDITDFLDCCISGLCMPPHGIYSCDIDHSGAAGLPDVLELIDLLNGIELFIPWDGVALPNNDCPEEPEEEELCESAQQELATSGGGALSTGALNQQHFADRFVAYLSTGTLADAVTEQDFRLILEALTRWAVDHFSREERETLASRLQDPSLSLENPTAAQMIPDTVAALLK